MQLIFLHNAGHGTTENLIGNGLVHLLANPEQLARLRADPGLDANAVEELLRFDAPIQFARRIATDPIELRGVFIPAGGDVMLALGAANRDPEKWGERADCLDLLRPDAIEHAVLQRRRPSLPRGDCSPASRHRSLCPASSAASPVWPRLRRPGVGHAGDPSWSRAPTRPPERRLGRAARRWLGRRRRSDGNAAVDRQAPLRSCRTTRRRRGRPPRRRSRPASRTRAAS